MPIEKPKLFLESWHFWLAISILLAIISMRLYLSYYSYSSFIKKPFYYLDVKVLNSYQKSHNDARYTVLKLQADNGMTFFSTTSKLDNLNHKKLRVQIYPNPDISFIDYLGYFYVKSDIKNISEIDKSTKSQLLSYIASQHDNSSMQSFYNAIFLATPLDKSLRDSISALGVSHLVALSGFHLGILWGLLYGVLCMSYRPIQSRYFPYRYTLRDMGMLTIILLGAYVWFVDFPPSLLRSYSMVLVGWIIVLLGIELVSFTFLMMVGLSLLVLFPSLVASLSFGLSIIGVFYIFLLLQHGADMNKWLISILLIPFGIFLLMLPIVHGIFGVTTPYQLLSPLLSLLFVPFYPLVMILHAIGIGHLLDPALLWLFALPDIAIYSEPHTLPVCAVTGYIALSVWAIWSRVALVVVAMLAVGYGVYLFGGW